MTRILMVTTSYPDASRGDGSEAAGSFVADFAASLSERADVRVVAPSLRASTSLEAAVRVDRFAVRSLPLSLLGPRNPAHWGAIAQVLRAGAEATMRAATAGPADHLLALWALPSGFWARRAARATGASYSIWALGSDIWSLGRVPVVRGVLRSVLRDAAHRFADGYALAADVEQLSGRGCRFLPSARSLPEAATRIPSSGPPYKLAYLGRWHPNKGIDLLLESLGELAPEDWARIAEVRICGGGPLESEVAAAVSGLASRGRPVRMQGYLDRSEAAELLTWADYAMLPSRIESVPVLFSDAMRCRSALVATPVGDLPRLLEEHAAGILASSPTRQGFTEALHRALGTSPSVFEVGMRSAAAAFDVGRAAETLLDALRAGE